MTQVPAIGRGAASETFTERLASPGPTCFMMKVAKAALGNRANSAGNPSTASVQPGQAGVVAYDTPMSVSENWRLGSGRQPGAVATLTEPVRAVMCAAA